VRVRVVRGGVAAAAAPLTQIAPIQQLQPVQAEPEIVRRQGTVVTSPMVGTVYLSPEPGMAPFVKVGDSVTDGTLCIIEAMKTMNPVPSPAAGRIAEIYVHDSQPVEFGEPLMLIE
jgi:acetyl-CoA carboxylase biotin carboxyl carrier protein